ncbi:MAG TPA: DUF4097 family beta strand repeat-containing protein [Acidimicrobiales bacterium]|nr:DUF4097 family beta strand repeat-containing protein [Acidimicrobiales bacterium]
MSRKLVTVLILLVGMAGVIVAAVATFAPVEDRTVTAQPGPIRGVEVDLEAGRVEIVPGVGNEATIDRTRRYLRGAPEVSEILLDGVLRIEAACEALITLGCRVNYRLEVPAAVPVRIRTDRGSVEITDMAGMVEVETGAGDVDLTRTRGPVRATTSAGDIDGVDLVAAFLDARTDAGHVRLSLAEPSARVDLRTDAGNIDLALPPAGGGYRVTTETGAGEVDVSVENLPGANRSVTATTGGGNIRIHHR